MMAGRGPMMDKRTISEIWTDAIPTVHNSIWTQNNGLAVPSADTSLPCAPRARQIAYSPRSR